MRKVVRWIGLVLLLGAALGLVGINVANAVITAGHTYNDFPANTWAMTGRFIWHEYALFADYALILVAAAGGLVYLASLRGNE